MAPSGTADSSLAYFLPCRRDPPRSRAGRSALSLGERVARAGAFTSRRGTGEGFLPSQRPSAIPHRTVEGVALVAALGQLSSPLPPRPAAPDQGAYKGRPHTLI